MATETASSLQLAQDCARANVAAICELHDAWHRVRQGMLPTFEDIEKERSTPDDIQQRARELAYSIVRTQRTVEILLAGGGPMVRLEVSRDGDTLSAPRIEYAHWFQAARRYPTGRLQMASLLWFARLLTSWRPGLPSTT